LFDSLHEMFYQLLLIAAVWLYSIRRVLWPHERAAARPQIARSAPVQRFRSRYPRAWAFVMRRFAPGEYLGLHLTIGLVISVAALWLFGAITEDVLQHEPLTQFDLTLLAWFHSYVTPPGMRLAVAISWLGSPAVMTTLGLMVALVLLGRRHMLLLCGWALHWLGAVCGICCCSTSSSGPAQCMRPPTCTAPVGASQAGSHGSADRLRHAGVSAGGLLGGAAPDVADHRARCSPADRGDWGQSALSRRALLQ
jgi:hypothetical protein